MEKKTPRRLQFAAWAPAVLWYWEIWRLSDQPAAVSGAVSDGLLGWVLGLLCPSYAGAAAPARIAAVEALSFFERKAAHMFLYFMLALFVYMAASTLRRLRGRGRYAATLALCALLAGLDEYHQTFIPGRSGELRDVLVDTAGAAIGLAFPALAAWIVRRKGRSRFSLVLPAAGAALALASPLLAGPVLERARDMALFSVRPPEGAVLAILREAARCCGCGVFGGCCMLGASVSGLRFFPALAFAALSAVTFSAAPGGRGCGVCALLGVLLAALVWAAGKAAERLRNRKW